MKDAIELFDKLLKVTPKQLIELRFIVEDLNPQLEAIDIKTRYQPKVEREKQVFEKIMATLPKWTIEIYEGFSKVEKEIRTLLFKKNLLQLLETNKDDTELKNLISQALPQKELQEKILQLKNYKIRDYGYTLNNVSAEVLRNLWKEEIIKFLNQTQEISFEEFLKKAFQNIAIISSMLTQLHLVGGLSEVIQKNFMAENYFQEIYHHQVKTGDKYAKLIEEDMKLNEELQEQLKPYEKVLNEANKQLKRFEKEPHSNVYKDAEASKNFAAEEIKKLRKGHKERPEKVSLDQAIRGFEHGLIGPRDALVKKINEAERPGLAEKIIGGITKSLSSTSYNKGSQSLSPPLSRKTSETRDNGKAEKKEDSEKKDKKSMLSKIASYGHFNDKFKRTGSEPISANASPTISPSPSVTNLPSSFSLTQVASPPGSARTNSTPSSARSDSTGPEPSSARSNLSPSPSPAPSPKIARVNAVMYFASNRTNSFTISQQRAPSVPGQEKSGEVLQHINSSP